MPDVVMNSTTMGLTGVTNLSTQTGTIGTIFGGALLVGAITLGMLVMHDYNRRKGFFWELINFFIGFGLFKALIGAWSVFVVWAGYEIAKWLGSSDGQGSLSWLFEYGLLALFVFIALIIIGMATQPIWEFLLEYATNPKRRK